ncbi:MAG: hypothetical protein CVV44_10940 [Spirochaetae bacterium HGW-Spirochaetae-1]|jgi:hypothetical protein|nr:MAG: hypothetical protein CVV44_10940 [Spirochaetae bacterium HGW-Spirochaetae-1]
MKRFFVWFSFLFCVSATVGACGDSPSWDTTVTAGAVPVADFGVYFPLLKKVAVDVEGNVYLAGSGFNLAGDDTKMDWWLRKFSPKGSLKWEKKLDGNGGNDEIRDLAFDAEDNVYVVGYGTNVEPGGSTVTHMDWWIKEFDPSGTELWDYKNNFQSGDDISTSIVIDHDGNIVVGGYFYNTAADHEVDYGIMKFAGETHSYVWATGYLSTFDKSTHDYLYALDVNANDDIYAAGTAYVNSNSDWWIIRINGDDGTLGTQALDYPGILSLPDEVKALSLNGSDAVYAVGSYYSQNTSIYQEWAVRKYDSDLNDDDPASMLIGNTTSESVDGGSDIALDLYIDGDDNVYVLGYFETVDGTSYVIKKYAADGILAFTRELTLVKTGTYKDYVSFAFDNAGHVYLAGNEYIINGDFVTFNWIIEKHSID